MSELKVPTCIWCGKTIIPTEYFVKFPCPNCGGVTITRCERCRKFGRPYKCPKCGFVGP
ncbi:zinc finger domain-containing protein [Candidatus Hecatella orcuttiae]|uniref:zinc finger domain-containing protein n=1 Tax=Candidatus Hecatella orcuttiae TaxID=1935119 RepID=UPI00286805D2|nr:zinc finger domain-containing protein [Candidatus Hecatella orcuttiae]